MQRHLRSRGFVAFGPARLSRATARRAAPRPPSCGSAAATAHRRGPRPRRARRARAAARASPRASSMPACGSPIAAKRAGIVSTVKSAGSQSGTSSQRERRRDARVGQRPHRIGRAGRAVLGVLVVVEEDAVALLLPPLRGRERRARAARSRARSASAARRTSVKVQRGSMRTLTCMPREPLVFGQPREARARRAAPSPPAPRGARRPTRRPAPGSRSMRSSSG